MYAVILLACLTAPPADVAPAPREAWIAGLPELLPAGTSFRWKGEVTIYSAAEAAVIRRRVETAQRRFDERQGLADGLIRPTQELCTVIECRSGRLTCLVPNGFVYREPTGAPGVRHIPLYKIELVTETAARYAERTGTPLPAEAALEPAADDAE
ncbi:hypothetical protein [Alienimonas californiensis]|uniref:Uncharacterized protein n=1 Tax=Alienimonas californiensis TaxID=2527989 RepID=A0A517P5K3_9PLAN|nr:hypothetical protein [Alienimonas californiensis]QDT14658.1 hypothetical protein CA12_07350 [Alienimonas californiensis]